MKALVVGCGSIGFRHIDHLHRLGLSRVEAVDSNPAVRDRVKRHYGLTVRADVRAALARRPDIVLVCTPASSHVPLALQALEAGAHVFIEKPLSTSLDGIQTLERRVRSDGRVVQVGYNLRYHPAMRAAKRLVESGRLGTILTAHAEFGLYLKKWWPGRDYRTSYMADSGESGGLLLDVSHEIDLLMWFLGGVKDVTAFGAKLSRLKMTGMDVIRVVMRMTSGALASLHMDCLQPTYVRGYTLVGEDTALRWDCPRGRADRSLGRLLVCGRKGKAMTRVPVRGRAQETYLEELRDFLASIRAGTTPAIDVGQGAAVLRVAMAIQRAIQSGRTVAVTS